jgi:dCTP deaminase
MYLPDHQIRKLCQDGVIQGYDDSLIGPASIDVRLGSEIMVEVPETPELRRLSIANTSRGNPYMVAPQEFFLAHTAEKFFIPAFICMEFRLKSSRGREGMSHALAVFGDPGFHNSHLTLELHSIRRYHSTPIWAGMLIGQMIFARMDSPPEKSYAITGRYNNSEGVVASKG